MSCAARELGLYLKDQERLPGLEIQDLIMGACGVPAVGLSSRVRSTIGGDLTTLRADIKRRLLPWLIQAPPEGQYLLGAALVQDGARAHLVQVQARRRIQLKPSPRQLKGKILHLRGVVLESAERIGAAINQGRFGYRECLQDPKIEFPHFHFTCFGDPQDKSAWVVVSSYPRGRLLGETLFRLQTRRSHNSPVQYKQQESEVEASVESLTTGVNNLRKRAGLPPLRLSRPQSQIAEHLAGTYFLASMGEMPQFFADYVAMGMMAGWSLGEPITQGRVTAHLMGGQSLLTALEALQRWPGGRAVIYDPEARLLALGLRQMGARQGLLLSSYRPLNLQAAEVQGQKAAQEIKARLDLLRQERGLPKSRESGAVMEHGLLLEREMIKEEMQKIMSKHQKKTRLPSRGWMLKTSDPEHFAFPAPFLVGKKLLVSIQTGWGRQPDQPWVMPQIFIAWSTPPP